MNTIGGAPACGNPTGLSNTTPTETSTTVSWNAVGGANNYDVDYKTNAALTWINAATATTALSVDLTGLTAVEHDVALGTGQLNIPEILKAAKKVGIKHYFIEDESPKHPEQIPVTIKYLRSLKH